MIKKTNSLIMLNMESNYLNPNGENIVAINLKIFHIFALENC